VHLTAWLAFAAAFAVLGLPLLAALAVLGAVGVLVLSVLAVARSYQRLGELEVEPAEVGTVMPGAEQAVAEFEAAGFRHGGAYQSTIDDRLAVLTVLVGPVQDRCAVVTDEVVELISTFDGRFLATANSASVPRIPALLRQQVARDTHVLLQAHQVAIDLLAERGLRPERFEDDREAVAASRTLEDVTIQFVLDAPLRHAVQAHLRWTGTDDRLPLGRDSASARRIDAWLASGRPP
jgi:hypothetical protein